MAIVRRGVFGTKRDEQGGRDGRGVEIMFTPCT
jgi:hypothetical protein